MKIFAPPKLIPVLALVLAVTASATAMAQNRGKKQEEDPALKPRPVSLKTKDDVKLTAFYFPSKEGKKDAVPVILVHEWKGQAAPYLKICVALREAGFAVLAVEYRGHGNSKTYTTRTGEQKDFNISTMSRRDVESIVLYDIEEAKQFLKGENNAERLNLNALCMIGVNEGAILAGYWSSRDWKIPSVGRMKQGQDVKALVYVSPEKNLNGMALATPAADPNLIQLPTLIVAGKESPQYREAEKLGGRLESVKKRLARGSVTGYEFFTPTTSLSGPALINDEASVIPKIVSFLKENVSLSDDENPWIERP